MEPEKPPETKNVIESYQELLEEEHPQLELLIWNHRLGHLPFIKIKILSLLGIIPNRISNMKTSKYEGCIYRAITKPPWRTKIRQANATQTVTQPGQCLLVDQLESPLPGFLCQLKVIPTNQWYRSATIFVDHFIPLGYVNLQSNLTT